MVPAYTPMPVTTSIETVPNVNRLAAALRETGGKVFWIQNTTNAASLTEWSNWFAMSRPELVQERIACQHRYGSTSYHCAPDRSRGFPRLCGTGFFARLSCHAREAQHTMLAPHHG